MTIIIITGLPGTGKTTLAKSLAQELELPLIGKDSIKEILFDIIGWSDREWSKKVGRASYALMDYFIESQLIAKQSFILESNFKPEFDNPRFQIWQRRHGYKVVQIVCQADGEVLYERFKQRALSGERHPGHVDSSNFEEFKESLLKEKMEPLSLKGQVLPFDTTDFSSSKMDTLLDQLHTLVTP